MLRQVLKNYLKKKILLLFFPLYIVCLIIYSQNISVKGTSWIVTVGGTAVQAGENPFVDMESAVNQILIDVHGQQDRGWVVDINKLDVNWDDNVVLSIHRTGEGSGGGTLVGGTFYIPIENTPKEFFHGGKNRTNIPSQYLLHFNAMPSAGNYSTVVYFTITNNI